MSGIFGWIDFEGKAPDEACMGRMQSALESWGPDGCAMVRKDRALLGQCSNFVLDADRKAGAPCFFPAVTRRTSALLLSSWRRTVGGGPIAPVTSPAILRS